MRFHDLSVRVDVLWGGAWLAWLVIGGLLPVPPWNAARVLDEEERRAMQLLPGAITKTWAIDVGGPLQATALGRGWSDNEAFVDGGRKRTFAWIDGQEGEVTFFTSGWDKAVVSARVFALPSLAPLTTVFELDGDPRAVLIAPGRWTVLHADLGAVARGRHLLRLVPQVTAVPVGEERRLSLAVDGLAIGPQAVEEPVRDGGVFVGMVRVGLTDRPALYTSNDAVIPRLPPGTETAQSAPGLVAYYSFGLGGKDARGASAGEAVHGIVTAALVILLPGLAWAGLVATRTRARLASAIAISPLVLLTAFLILRVTGHAPGPLALATALAILGGLPLLRARPRLLLPWPVLLAGLSALVPLIHFATRVVPPLEDQDMEVQATAFALATRQRPDALTNRGTTSFFAHPPLVHLWEAGSFALSGRLDRVRYYSDAAVDARRQPSRPARSGEPLAVRSHAAEWRQLLRRFLGAPELWVTRQTNVLLAALLIAVLMHFTATLTSSRTAGWLFAGTVATFPEFLVRGAYGGYFAATAFLSLLLLVELEEGAPPLRLGAASACAALSDQKGLLVPVAWVIAARAVGLARRFWPLAAALFGLLAFALWGLATDPSSFVSDFAQEHVIRRLSPTDVRLVSEAGKMYPSVVGLWREFAAHYGSLFTVALGVASICGLKSRRAAVRCAAVSVLIGAFVFSVTDWRQTKHLSLLVVPGVVAMSGLWPRSRARQYVALAVLGLMLVTNVVGSMKLLADFASIQPKPSW